MLNIKEAGGKFVLKILETVQQIFRNFKGMIPGALRGYVSIFCRYID